MNSIITSILLGFVARTCAQETSKDLLDMVLDRAFRAGPGSLMDLDDTTAAKSVAQVSPATNLVAKPVQLPQSRTQAQFGGMSSTMSSRMPHHVSRAVASTSQTDASHGRNQFQPKAVSQARQVATSAAVSGKTQPAGVHFFGKKKMDGKGDPVVAVVGYTGGVGTCLLAAMERIGLPVFAKVSSKGMEIKGEKKDVDWDALNQELLAAAKSSGGVPVLVDVTASGAVQELYEPALKLGISVVAANKGIFAGPEGKYQALLDAAEAEPKARMLHEATVGAGLPVISTIKDLVDSSHQVESVEGILSGTLAFVLGEVAGGKKKFSEAVAEAKALGYTEPDPRDDLNGMDVARKSVILARVAGLKGVELSAMNIESLVPESLRDCSVDEFMAGLPQFDDDFAKRVAAVEAKGDRLHYAGAVDMKAKKVTVGPLGFEASHPFNNAGPDNLVSIKTNFYTRPLVVQGAGAGGDVTATGVLADITKAMNQPLK